MLQVILFEIHKRYTEFFKLSEDLPKKQEYGFAKLYEYYCSIQVASPKKKAKTIQNKTQHSLKPIVFLIQDVESFNPEILQKLIYLCKIYCGKLPIVLIFGMASSMFTLHDILPPKALCCLGLETFHSVSAAKFLTRIIEEVIISPDLPFKFGPKMFRLIVDSVLYHDFSISNLTYMLKFSLIEHFYGKTYASLCCHKSEIEKKVNQLNPKYLHALKELPSLKTYLENNPRFLSTIDDPKVFKELIVGFMKKLYESQRINLLLLKILHCLVKDLPRHPLGKQIRELYSVSLEKEISLDEGYTQSMNLIRLHSKENLMAKLETCLNIICDSYEENGINLKSVNSIKHIVEDCIERLSKISSDDFEKNLPEPLIFQNEKITSRFQLQEKIQMNLKLKRSNFEVVLSGIVQNLNMIFKNISPPSHSPLYEIFYFDDVSAAKKHLMAVPRVTSCCTLSNPHYYLQCKCCEITSPDEVRPTMPEISILYKLHLQSGKLINLYDWLEGFKGIVSAEENTKRKSRTKTTTNDSDLNVRFLLTVSELQMLGFIKPTKRKTDHVARTTFGCF
ncbi:origin recognition complex subunit 3-like isoform X2 [Argiope bruennichi]|nr:origin recognition complex subunit 3-like isoform X2 [Argiope bruennichi]